MDIPSATTAPPALNRTQSNPRTNPVVENEKTDESDEPPCSGHSQQLTPQTALSKEPGYFITSLNPVAEQEKPATTPSAGFFGRVLGRVYDKDSKSQSTPDVASPHRDPEIVSPSRATSIRPNLRKAPTAPNAATDGFPSAYPSRANSQGPPGTRTPYVNGDAPALSRLPLKDLLLNPKKKLASDVGLTWKVAAKNIFFSSWLNMMLVFIPVSWAMHFSHQSDTLIFVFSFLAIVPLASCLGFATEQLALRVGDSLGGLLNATFGNAVELLISILALVKGEIDIVQSSMIGSILSNTLLVLGMCFFAGGLRFHEQGYGIRAAQLNISLLGIAVIAIVLPSAFHIAQGGAVFINPKGEELASILSISRGIAFLLLFVYVGYLTFQLYTHAYLFKTVTPYQRRKMEAKLDESAPSPPGSHVFRLPGWVPSIGGSSSSGSSTGTLSRRNSDATVDLEAGPTQTTVVPSSQEEEEEELEVPKLTRIQAAVALAVVTVLTGITAEWLIDSIDGMTETGGVSREFVALILLPLVGNAAEHVTAVVVSVKDKIDLSLSIAVGSSIQIGLFVIPFLVVLGWAIGQPLTMRFDMFETVALLLSVWIVNSAIQDGKTNYMEGICLMSVYAILALVTWYYPGARAIAAAQLGVPEAA